ncbi:MAG TPA: HYR domain-containing protein, partial [Vicinamibacterales bacterium]|nr:HYR domain-containing protein [Vicinamibacterales bacterium]
MRSRAWLVAAIAVALAVWTSPMQERVSAQSGSPGIVISEYRLRGPNGANDEFIELFNGGLADVDVSGWLVRSATGNIVTSVTTLPSLSRIRRGCFFLITNTNVTNSAGVIPDHRYANGNGTPDGGGFALFDKTSAMVDQVGNSTGSAFGEGTRLPAFPNNTVNQSYERRASAVSGFVDTNNNAADFQLISPATPHNGNPVNCLTPVNLTVNGTASPTHVEQGQRVVLTATVTPATLPGSTNLQVSGNLSAIGGAIDVEFANNGVAPDEIANDNVFSVEAWVPQGTPLGPRPIAVKVIDQQGRRDNQLFSVNVTLPAALYLPHEIQGAGATTPIAIGDPIMVRGVVTAKRVNGFFLQTEPGMEDADSNTSEALFVPANAVQLSRAVVGHLVYVKGLAAELVPVLDPGSPSITAVGDLSFIFDLGESSMPAAVELTTAELSDAGTLDQLERFEGMRVHASLVAVSGTALNGAFYAVLNGQGRPFREPGVESGYPVLSCAVGPCNVPRFDGNPERLRVDSDGQIAVGAVDVSSGAVMEVTGPLDFRSRTFTIVPDAEVTFAGGVSVRGVPAADGNQFTVASFFLGGAVNAHRLAKASLAIRHGLNMPDIVGVQEVEDLAALTALAQAIDADAAAGGQAAPNYAALVLADSDARVGVLVKQAAGRVTVNEFDAAGADAVMVRATVNGPSTMLPQAVTVIVPHLLSKEGSETNDAAGALVREQRKAQAEALANFIQSRQSNDPGEAIISIGDYNAFGFNDGYVDVVGTIKGDPAAADRVATQTTDVVSPDLIDVGALMPPARRYSSVSDGNAQALDHALATANLASQFAGVARARINADFPARLRANVTSPSGLSDRDPMVVYFRFPADTLAPVINGVADQVADATGANGATVYYNTPTATDNLDGVVPVTCAPASGSVFPFGDTAVMCSTHDAAGNVAEASFTVSVGDTTAPVLALPSDIFEEAASADGSVVAFAVSATDAVTPEPQVVCSPSSGSLFAAGLTEVECVAHDAHGNTSTGSFNVIVTDTTAPSLTVPGNLTEEATSAAGATVLFSATATDAVSALPMVGCSPSSGSDFALGVTTVRCTAQDAAANTSSQSFTITVRDTTAPVIAVPPDQVTEAGSAAGTAVWFVVSATDAVTASPSVGCSHASGSTFPIGTTTVECTSSDAAGNTGNNSFNVIVTDTTAPSLTVPGNLTEEATSAAGATVLFSATAADAVSASPLVGCSPSSGSIFALGATTVRCTADDTAENTSSKSFTITVRDTTAPVIVVPPDQVTEAGSAVGTAVSFVVSATDAVTASPSVSCSHASGSTFPIGTTTVRCTSSDAVG